MAKLPVLIDSGFLYELFDSSAPKHLAALRAIAKTGIEPLIPQVVLSETAYLFKRTGGMRASASLLEALDTVPGDLLPVTHPDLRRAREIMLRYASASLDFVDCCIMALCERLNVTTVCIFDRRDFSIVQLAHADHLTLLPETV